MHAFKKRNERAIDQSLDMDFFWMDASKNVYVEDLSVAKGASHYKAVDITAITEVVGRKRPDLIACFFWGNDNFVLGALNHPRPFDFILPNYPQSSDFDQNAEIIPYD